MSSLIGATAGRPRAPALGDLDRVPRRPDGERHEVVDMSHGLPSEFSTAKVPVSWRTRVAGQKLQRGIVASIGRQYASSRSARAADKQLRGTSRWK